MHTPEQKTFSPGTGAQQGLSLVELVVFIVIVSVGLVGVLGILNVTAARSADPLVRKQALSVAESLLEEISLMPFTYCDPDDPAAATATAETDCATPESMTTPGPETAQGESRYSTTAPFDNVNDYDGFTMAGIRDLTGTPVPGLGAYAASVRVTAGGLGIANASDVALVTVTVTGPGNESVVLHGYRVRYAPNALP
ncbi:MAG: type II secretion system protein [Betaproteobacteria bacterium]|nr:type II secretion system protein [Betaproteobacteria bacterium]